MTDELESAIKRIKSLSPKLNKATDEAARIVEQVEKFLEECSIGISAEASFSWRDTDASDEDTEDHRREIESLVYERIAGKYRIGVATETWTLAVDSLGQWDDLDSLVEREALAWSSADRERKLTSFDKLPKLLAALATKVEEATKNVDNASRAAADITAAMTAESDADPRVATVETKRETRQPRFATIKVGRAG